MSDLHQAIHLLGANIQRVLRADAEWPPEMSNIQGVEKRLVAAADKQMEPQEIDYDALLEKIKGEKELSYREKRALPFVLLREACSARLFQACIKAIDFGNSGQVRRLFFVYLSQYGEDKKNRMHRQKMDLLARILQAYFQKRPAQTYVNRLLAMGYKYGKTLFFGEASTDRMAGKMASCNGMHACYEELNLPRGLYGCAYMREALRKLFLMPDVSVAKKFRFLDEMIASMDGKASYGGEIYADVDPAAATGLILGVEAMKTAQKQPLKKRCIDIFYERLGDPRFGTRTIRWESVSKKARTIFLHWLAENDLNLFFRIIEETAVDAMWSYRKRFWERYLPYITNTWVFFGKDAAYLARTTKEYHASYGLLGRGCTPDQSAFAFQIGAYVFVEWSHNGMLRVWKASAASRVFGAAELDKSDVVNSSYEESWRHAGKENYRWQNHVSTWLYQHCKIK